MSLTRKNVDRDGAFSGNAAQRAIIDIGSNTVRLVVYGGSPRAPTVLLNEKVAAQLGRDIARTGKLSPDAIDLAMRGLRRFALLLADLGVDNVETIATAAVREASNGPEFVDALRELGFLPQVITGEEEACLSASGVAGAFPGASGIVADLGGGSLELVAIDEGAPGFAVSLPLGTLRLPDFRDGAPGDVTMRKPLEKALVKGAGQIERNCAPGRPLYLVGGTWRSMAVYAMQEQGHPLSDPHGFDLDAPQAKKLAKALSRETAESLAARDRISSMRAEKLPDASILLQALLKRFEPSEIIFSSWGLREGVLYDRLQPHQRMQDPLLAGVGVFAAQRGAPPTLAARIAAWTVDAAPAREHGSERLRLAATMLALASMQIEPNIRHPLAVEWALHKRWIAISERERAMLAAAIAANGNHRDLPASVTELASKPALEEAICWGLAIRMARRIGARSRRSFQVSRLRVQSGMLVLRLERSHEALFGIPTEKDISLLADRLGLGWSVETVPDGELHDEEGDSAALAVK